MNTVNRHRLLIGCAALMAALLAPAPALSAESTADPDAACRACHRDQLDGGLAHRAHGSLDVSCTACHGASEAHAAAPNQPPTVRFTGDDGGAGENACLSCHDNDVAGHWAFSPHADTQAGCVGCHDIHSATDPIQQQALAFEVCTDCHRRERAEQMRFSRHPMQEGHVQCSDCHAPHGGAAMNGLTQASLNDVCYQCHAAKRGPFLFEHEPVQDDCSHCHQPHASVNDHLLKSRQPMLCQQCHIAARHPGRVYDSMRLETRDVNIIGQACTNCHSQVHGGNQPESTTFRR